MQTTETPSWRKCSSCKKPIGFNAKYYVCSVSTCNGERTGYVFCSVPCFEVHLPGARHKDAAAIESKSPAAGAPGPSRKIISSASSGPSQTNFGGGVKTQIQREVLVIASRLKEYIQARGDMNTSANVMDVLSDHLRVMADRAIDSARADGRKTVLDRDFSFLKK